MEQVQSQVAQSFVSNKKTVASKSKKTPVPAVKLELPQGGSKRAAASDATVSDNKRRVESGDREKEKYRSQFVDICNDKKTLVHNDVLRTLTAVSTELNEHSGTVVLHFKEHKDLPIVVQDVDHIEVKAEDGTISRRKLESREQVLEHRNSELANIVKFLSTKIKSQHKHDENPKKKNDDVRTSDSD
jgi:hypothetical protein